MAFDPRSLERLRELGRSLPQPLPKPEPKPPASARARAAEPRHKVETETDPEQLFRELMAASADGTVPPHLMERLRQLEGERRQRRAAGGGDQVQGQGQGDAAPPSSGAAGAGARGKRGTPQAPIGRPDPRLAAAHGDLYTAFQQLLLEDDELD